MIFRLDLTVNPHPKALGGRTAFWTQEPGWDRAHARLPRLGRSPGESTRRGALRRARRRAAGRD